ncbi:MAG: hypothetical protein LQ352_000902 [Teloschistes flavicans]|nr:MAG: hypothetical protein LQ352_000902 [Teloschistes flavicans]
MSDDRISQEDSRNELSGHLERTASESTLLGTEIPSINIAQDGAGDVDSDEDQPPPLPPRPKTLEAHRRVSNVVAAGFASPQYSARPRLQATATTALSRTDIHTQSYQDGSRETYAASKQASPPTKSWGGWGSIRRLKIHDGDETASIRSSVPTLGTGGDVESLLGGFVGHEQTSGSNILERQLQEAGWEELDDSKDDEVLENFDREFDEVGTGHDKSMDEEKLLAQWKSKRKHFMILSSAGKPIYTRHGDDNLISGYIGIIQTIISFYEGAQDQLRGFTAGGARFVIMSQGPLYLVAVSKLGESAAQLRVQLEALYMQILSTLTLPNLTHLFSNRPSTDLRRPLRGTEPLLSALADSFTRGSFPTLFSALECLKIRKAHREVINNTLLQKRCESLLYGLVVAGGRLVSVVRPWRHSLHPSDLQLIFNMLFEAEGVKAGGGENWIPLCLPGFNRNGYLYMYVSFLDGQDKDSTVNQESTASRHDEVAVLLISADKESFYDLRNMRDTVVEELEKNGSMSLIKSAIEKGRFAATDIVPGTVLHHFIYKSRANVQFTMPSYEPHFTTLEARRKLLSLYHTLHANVHAKNAHLNVQHCISRKSVSLAWITPLFELYCMAGPNTSRNALAQSANKVVQWARREEERIFIIGGAVRSFHCA